MVGALPTVPTGGRQVGSPGQLTTPLNAPMGASTPRVELGEPWAGRTVLAGGTGTTDGTGAPKHRRQAVADRPVGRLIG